MNRIFTILINIIILSAIVIPVSASTRSSVSGYTGFPTFSIESVVVDKSVTIKTNNLPPNDTFTVTMGKIGSLGVGGTVVKNTDSGTGGSQTLTYDIPSTLVGQSLVAIRLQSPTTGYYAYNWFFNDTTASAPAPQPTPTPSATPSPSGYSGFPTITITAVKQGQTVTVSGINFPPADTFTVLMGAIGSRGIGGKDAGTTNTGRGGSFTETFTIPSSLAGADQIAIRLQSPTSGYFAFNWFWNATTP
jgi:hypothetical protein